jgi:hypothetical protein
MVPQVAPEGRSDVCAGEPEQEKVAVGAPEQEQMTQQTSRARVRSRSRAGFARRFEIGPAPQ